MVNYQREGFVPWFSWSAVEEMILQLNMKRVKQKNQS